ncbi:hypothetical protein AK812_SmicGene38526 [Symbiodinium microadriaticum]|uniref:Uncharacterized protein n=1 Tax=Symbiodinium microadriaticum TaxID=2951 RepID=A0A1Q9CDU0_SYMMI|nr:hypothetical protein AK812_SmicGene38526 [Symbiodinium microadriaticum]
MAPTNDTIGRPFAKVVFAVKDATGNAASCIANNMDVESVAQVMLMKLYLLFNEVSAKLFGRGKESAFAGVLKEVVLRCIGVAALVSSVGKFRIHDGVFGDLTEFAVAVEGVLTKLLLWIVLCSLSDESLSEMGNAPGLSVFLQLLCLLIRQVNFVVIEPGKELSG